MISLILVACSGNDSQLNRAEQLIETAPDSALHLLRHLPPHKYKSASNRALYGLLMIRALDKKLLPLKPDSLLDYSISYYREHGNNNRLASCYFYRGRTYRYSFQYEKAMSYYLKALDTMENDTNHLLLARINFDMGDIYLVQREYVLSRQKYLQAYALFRKVNNATSAFYSLVDVGRTYSQEKLNANAQVYFKRAFGFAKDSLMKGVALQELGIDYFYSHQPDSALVYLRKVIRYPYLANNRAIRYYYLADLYFDLNKPDSAYYCANKAFAYQPDIRTQRECYRILVNTVSLKGNLTALKQYMLKYQACSDSLRKIDSQTKGSVLETIHKNSTEYVRVKARFWYLFGFIVILGAGATLLFRKRMKRSEQEFAVTGLPKIDHPDEAMIRHRAHLQKRIKAIRINQSPERIKAGVTKKEELDRKLYEELLHINEPELFYREMDAVLNNLASKLRSRYPSLNSKEIIWCCLHLMNIPTYDILNLLGYKTQSLKKMRQRLATKVGLIGVTEIDQFLNAILNEE